MTPAPLTTAAVLALPLTGLRLIEASAGTGKTYTIANLYLRHVAAGRQVGEILVVTFTVAATDELRGRVRSRLHQARTLLAQGGASGDPFLEAFVHQLRARGEEARVRDRLTLAVRAMDEAAIYTIHGFCQRALGEFPFNSGQQFRLEVMSDDGPLRREAEQDWWRRTGYPLDPARTRLFLEAVTGLETFRRDLAPLLTHPPRVLLPEPEDLETVFTRCDALGLRLVEVAAAWRRDGEGIKRLLQGSKGLSRNKAISPYHLARLEPALAQLDAWAAGDPSLPPPKAAFAVVDAATLARHRLQTPDPDLDDPFFTRCGELAAARGALTAALRVAALADARAFVARQVAAAKEHAQAIAFDDLLSRMRQALEGPTGAPLATALRGRFPVALIDEFQDTDPVQYAIFRRIYQGVEDCGLTLIGDPKQAIYSFRGGDIFTYMEAKRDVGAGAVHTLGINWRSTPGVVNGVNRLFQHRPRDAFVYGEAIPFHPAAPAADKAHRPLVRDGAPQAALTLWTLPPDVTAKGEPKVLSKDHARALTHAAVADEVARLVAAGQAGRARVGERPLAPRDIAILVRTSHEAAELRPELAARGIAAVAVERTGVFATPEAAALEMLLRGVLDPRDRTAARRALGSPLLGLGYREIAATAATEGPWADWVDRLLALGETWARRGFMAMFQHLLRALGIAEALARGPQGERRLTNLLHLGELLQQASKVHGGMDALVQWLARQREEAAAEQSQLRLESDAELVQIVTIHASKGLEYPVVFVPYLWGCTTRDGDDPLAFHRGAEACLDAGSPDYPAHLLQAEQERLAEDVRLAYVALTRAESALYLVWGRAGSRDGHAGQTALAWLLHPHQSREDLERTPPSALEAIADLDPDLDALAAAAGGDIVVAPLPAAGEAVVAPAPQGPPDLAPRAFTGTIPGDWRVASFSALTREVHAAASAPVRDEGAADVGLRFPAGSHVGSYLHLLLEHLDLQGDVAAQVAALGPAVAARFGIDHGRWGADAGALLARAVVTPLDGDGLTLASLDPGRRLAELAFDFATAAVDPGALDRVLAAAADGPVSPLRAERFQGLVTGVIDLVFEHRGRFYLADYKSNFLGARADDYAPAGLAAAVRERRYDLQYLLYTLALHRYLGRRLPGYAYGRHFGGVYYLFLRAMRPETGPARGVWFTRPEEALVAALDRDVFRFEAAP